MNQGSRLLLMVVSFLLSLTLWVYVQVQENPLQTPKTSYVLPLVAKGLPDNLLIVNMPDKITAFPKGALEERRLIDPKDLSAVVDLSNANPQNQEYPVHILNSGDYIVHWKPIAAVVRVEKKVTETKRVKVIDVLEPPDRSYLYLPESTYTEPANVNVTGPESVLKDVSVWVELDLSKVRPGMAPTEAPVHVDVNGAASAPGSVTWEPETVKIHPAILVGTVTRTLHVMPTFTGWPAFGYEVKSYQATPDNVEVRGSSDSLSGLQFLPIVRIDLSGIKKTTDFLAVPILPPGVVITSPEQIGVKVVIEPVKPPEQPKPTPEIKPKPRRRRQHE